MARKPALRTILKRIGVDRLYYMAPIENALMILAIGILPYNRIERVPHRVVSWPSVQRLRRARMRISGRSVHDYVPLYFATHTPMQYVLTTAAPSKNRVAAMAQNDLVFFEVDAEGAFKSEGVLFTDGNAAASKSRTYSKPQDLANLDWEAIRRPNEHPHCYDKEWRRKKAAEVLVPDHVPPDLFTRIVVYDEDAADRIRTKVDELCRVLAGKIESIDWAKAFGHEIVVDRAHYFQRGIG